MRWCINVAMNCRKVCAYGLCGDLPLRIACMHAVNYFNTVGCSFSVIWPYVSLSLSLHWERKFDRKICDVLEEASECSEIWNAGCWVAHSIHYLYIPIIQSFYFQTHTLDQNGITVKILNSNDCAMDIEKNRIFGMWHCANGSTILIFYFIWLKPSIWSNQVNRTKTKLDTNLVWRRKKTEVSNFCRWYFSV